MPMDWPISRALAEFTLDNATWTALVIAAAATMFILARAKMKSKRDPLQRRSTSSSLAQERAVERQMSNLIVELSEMARAVSAGLDTRAAKLNVLLDEADKRIAELRALIERSAAALSSLESNRSAPPRITQAPEPPPPDDPIDARHVEVYSLADKGRSAHEIAAALGRPKGEIELILALRPRSPASSSA